MGRAIRAAAYCLVTVAGIGGCAGGLDDAVRQEIRERVSSTKAPPYLGGVSWKLVRQVYGDRKDRPLWSKGGHPLGRARDLVASICRAEREGLRPADYDLQGLREAVQALKDKETPGPTTSPRSTSGSPP